MQIIRNGTLPGSRPPERNFTGDVTISGYVQQAAPSGLAGATVTFSPGARTPWKVNPRGQTLIVTSGVGWAQSEGEEVAEIRAGDVVWYPPGQWHWDGAAPHQAMTYVAIQETQDGTTVFGEKVTDEEYRKGPPAASSMRRPIMQADRSRGDEPRPGWSKLRRFYSPGFQA